MLFFRRVSKVFKLALLPTDYDEEQLLKNTLSGDDPSAIAANILICGRSATVHVETLQCLLPDEPLNSETINFYLLMVEAAAAKRLKVISFNSFFMSKIEKKVS
jgi:Ulp1 family protease